MVSLSHAKITPTKKTSIRSSLVMPSQTMLLYVSREHILKNELSSNSD